jgi:hypothetical protein
MDQKALTPAYAVYTRRCERFASRRKRENEPFAGPSAGGPRCFSALRCATWSIGPWFRGDPSGPGGSRVQSNLQGHKTTE